MITRKQHAYQVALRMARVKELRAQMALSVAVDQERIARQHVESVEAAHGQVALATQACMADGRPVDMARYTLLTQLSSALADSLQLANDELEHASRQRSERASENVQAKRQRERVNDRLDDVRATLLHVRGAKAMEEGVERWLDSRQEQP